MEITLDEFLDNNIPVGEYLKFETLYYHKALFLSGEGKLKRFYERVLFYITDRRAELIKQDKFCMTIEELFIKKGLNFSKKWDLKSIKYVEEHIEEPNALLAYKLKRSVGAIRARKGLIRQKLREKR